METANASHKVTWTLSTKDFMIARAGDLVVFVHRKRLNFGPGDRRNGYQWIASWDRDGKEHRKTVSGKREVAKMMAEMTCDR